MTFINENKKDLVLEPQWGGCRVFCIGDVHGENLKLFKKIDYWGITDAIMVHLGDNAEGFLFPREKQLRVYNALNEEFKKRNILYLSIRGNHSFAQDFDGSINLSNFKLLKYYTHGVINGLKWGFVGGAISVDRVNRLEGVSYWADEPFVLRKDLIQPCDVLISHSCGNYIGPIDKRNIQYWIDRESKDLNWVGRDLWKECQKERLDHNTLFELSKPKYALNGHFHESAYRSVDGCHCRILDILEFYEFNHK